MRRTLVGALLAVVAAALVAPAPAGAGTAQQQAQQARTYLVLYKQGVSPASARAAIAKAGGVLVQENKAIGLAW